MRTLLTAILLIGATSVLADGNSEAPPKVLTIKVDTSPSTQSPDYVMDLVEAMGQAKKLDKKVILYTGHNYHLKKLKVATPRDYFERVLVKASPVLMARRSEFIVCELFEFTPMHDAKGNFTPEYFKMITGWFGALNDRYDIRFFTPTVNFLDSNGTKLAGPFDNFAGFGEAVDAALGKIQPLSK